MAVETDTFTTFVIGLASVGVAGFVGWTIASFIRVKSDLNDFKVHVAENYTKNAALENLSEEVRHLGRIIYEIAGKLGVSVRKD